VQSTAGSIIHAFRKNFEITLKELSKLTGIPESSLSAIENGKIDIGVKRATLIAAAFGISPESLLFPHGKSLYEKEAVKARKAASKMIALKRKRFTRSQDEAA
jgi:transcriptional regulator with XRE-family HTH domain